MTDHNPPRLWHLWYSPKMHEMLRRPSTSCVELMGKLVLKTGPRNAQVFPDGRVATLVSEDVAPDCAWDDMRYVGEHYGRGGSWSPTPADQVPVVEAP